MRDVIVIKALQQINEQGLKFTTAGLAQKLGVSKRALYQHFNSKEDLLGAVFDSILNDLRQQISRIALDEHLDSVEKLKALMLASPKALGPLTEQVLNDVRRFMPNQWEKFEKYFEDKWEKIELVINQGVERGLFRPVNLTILQKIYMGTVEKLSDFNFLMQNNSTLRNAITETAEILIYGIMAPDCRDTHPSAQAL
ncbi:TetR/AcrR family transcriptional regulator [Geobacter sp. FeAm09]|uniref:TetR/AcrR family transcriptional regulator n=1 Tax=Geobacter sp. FeAm09 TaxID=2597769 RepID=UPI0011EEC079|nr:TetR/AcrR family transcriptional regulator [Geobacter sp. FeAm09]QEM67013.1 TetR/AcrR family transcriptional regulator [Geobacter sp. FeAm09]